MKFQKSHAWRTLQLIWNLYTKKDESEKYNHNK